MILVAHAPSAYSRGRLDHRPRENSHHPGDDPDRSAGWTGGGYRDWPWPQADFDRQASSNGLPHQALVANDYERNSAFAVQLGLFRHRHPGVDAQRQLLHHAGGSPAHSNAPWSGACTARRTRGFRRQEWVRDTSRLRRDRTEWRRPHGANELLYLRVSRRAAETSQDPHVRLTGGPVGSDAQDPRHTLRDHGGFIRDARGPDQTPSGEDAHTWTQLRRSHAGVSPQPRKDTGSEQAEGLNL